MGFNSHKLPFYLWAKRGKRANSGSKTAKKRCSVLAAYVENKLIVYKAFFRAVNAQAFGAFMLEIAQVLESQRISRQELVVVLDNATIHKAKCLTNLHHCYNFLFLPPYSPAFNLIEKLFSVWKGKLRKLNHIRAPEYLTDALRQGILQIRALSLGRIAIEFYRDLEQTALTSAQMEPEH